MAADIFRELSGRRVQMTDFSQITACGQTCEGCRKKAEGICNGCIEADGYVPEWEESGRCKVHACTREHNAPFCGVCECFPCPGITSMIHWEPDIVGKMERLAGELRSLEGE